LVIRLHVHTPKSQWGAGLHRHVSSAVLTPDSVAASRRTSSRSRAPLKGPVSHGLLQARLLARQHCWQPPPFNSVTQNVSHRGLWQSLR